MRYMAYLKLKIRFLLIGISHFTGRPAFTWQPCLHSRQQILSLSCLDVFEDLLCNGKEFTALKNLQDQE